MKVISELTGGFGNQMFAYATAYAVAKKNNGTLYINSYMSDNGMTRELGIDKLNIVYEKRLTYKYKKDILSRAVFNKLRRAKTIGFGTRIEKENGNFVYHPEIMTQKRDVMLSGYWQSAKYFDDYRADICRMYTPKAGYSADAKELLALVQKPDTVAVHIRRGDYLDDNMNLTMDYFERAFSIIEEKIQNPIYCFFSDDIAWVKENFQNGRDNRYLSGMKPIDYIEEFFVMSACANQIISNSSFSWWAAYLNPNPDKIVIAPEVEFWNGDFYPDSWIKLSSDNFRSLEKK
jgi:hypothetical protein